MQQQGMVRWTGLALLLLSGVVAWFIVTRRHVDVPLQHDWRTFLWADQAGYYIYLPAHFIYNWDGQSLPGHIEAATGYGFQVDTLSGLIRTKYPVGTALMQAPFFLVTHAWCLISGKPPDGFSAPYIHAVMFAGIVWGCLGLFWLWGFLKRRSGEALALLTVALIWLGTGVLYYHSENSGMSHIYSFALFSLLLLHLDKMQDLRVGNMMLAGFLASLIVLVRPTGIIGIAGIVLMLAAEGKPWLSMLKPRPVMLVPVVLAGLVTLLPQLAYWKYAHGSWVSYSYGNESFSNWQHPEIVKFWFSPNNGLFPYGPVWVFIVSALIWGSFLRQLTAVVGLVLFLGVSYLFSSWHIWFFGCGFGSRNLVEYAAILALPFSLFLKSRFGPGKMFSGLVLAVFLILSSALSLKLFNSYLKCFFGRSDWDWKEYAYLATRKNIQIESSEPVNIPEGTEYFDLYSFRQSDLTRTYLKEIKGEFEWGKTDSSGQAKLVLVSEEGIGDPFYSDSGICSSDGCVSRIKWNFWPQQSDETRWKVYVYNPGRTAIRLNKFSLDMH